MKISVFVLLLLLSSCSTKDSAKLDSLINLTNSSSAQNLAKIASSSDPKAAAKSMLDAKRNQWERDPIQLAKDLKVAKRDFDNLMNTLSGNVKRNWGKKESRLPEQKTYVKYSKQYKSRAIVDFEHG